MKPSRVDQLARIYRRGGTLLDSDVLLTIYEYSELNGFSAIKETLAPETLFAAREAATNILDKLGDHADSYDIGFTALEAPIALTSIPREFIKSLVENF